MSGRKKEPLIYVVEAKWKGTSHAWIAFEYIGGGMAAFGSKDKAEAEAKRLRVEESMFCGMPMVYRLTSYLRAAEVIE